MTKINWEEKENVTISLQQFIWESDENHCTCNNCRSIRWNKETKLCNRCEYEWY